MFAENVQRGARDGSPFLLPGAIKMHMQHITCIRTNAVKYVGFVLGI